MVYRRIVIDSINAMGNERKFKISMNPDAMGIIQTWERHEVNQSKHAKNNITV